MSFSFEAGHSESHVNRQGRDRFACLGLERMGSVGHSSLFLSLSLGFGGCLLSCSPQFHASFEGERERERQRVEGEERMELARFFGVFRGVSVCPPHPCNLQYRPYAEQRER